MKKKVSTSTCETSAARVTVFFSDRKLSKPSVQGGNLAKAHQCDLVKIPRVPASIEHLMLYGKCAELQKKQSQNQKKPSLLKPSLVSIKEGNPSPFKSKEFPLSLDDNFGSGQDLKPERVKNWKLKEHTLAARRIKGFQKERESLHPSKHHISIIKQSTAAATAEKEQNEYWKELLNTKEERHFHLTRVIKFLVD